MLNPERFGALDATADTSPEAGAATNGTQSLAESAAVCYTDARRSDAVAGWIARNIQSDGAVALWNGDAVDGMLPAAD